MIQYKLRQFWPVVAIMHPVDVEKLADPATALKMQGLAKFMLDAPKQACRDLERSLALKSSFVTMGCITDIQQGKQPPLEL